MIRLRNILALLALVSCTTGCTFSRIRLGQPVTPAQAARVELGASKSTVLEMLGAPDQVSVVAAGSVFEYLYRQQTGRELQITLFRASFTYDEAWSRADRLVIRFDRDGLVREYGVVTAGSSAVD